MGYKQNNSPFTKLGEGFTDPKRIRRNNKAYEFNQKGLEDILNVTADGAEVIDDKSSTDKTGTENEGKVGENEKALDGMNSIDLKKIELATGAIRKSEEIDKKKKSIKERKRNAKLDKQNLRRAKRLNRRDEYADDDDLHKLKEKVEFNKKERKNLKGKTTSEAQSLFDDAYSRGIENAKKEAAKEAAEAKKEEERKAQENYEKRIKDDPNYMMQDIGPNLGNKSGGSGMYKQNDMDNKEIKYGTRHLKSKGSAFPMVAQTPKVDAYGNPEQQPNRAARGFESNQLTNNPNIQQPANKVANSTFNTNQKFSNIASSAGEMDQTRNMPQSNYGNTPAYGQPAKALIGDQPNLPDHLKAHINAAPGMYDQDGPSIKKPSKGNSVDSLMSKDLKDNIKEAEERVRKAKEQNKAIEAVKSNPQGLFQEIKSPKYNAPKTIKENGDIEPAPAMYNDSDGPSVEGWGNPKIKAKPTKKSSKNNKEKSKNNKEKPKSFSDVFNRIESPEYKAPELLSENSSDVKLAPAMHTKVTKSNVKSAEKDDAAHIDYLKRDINYDNRHGGSNKQMTNDEKHISKLAGDIKYDHKHHGRKYDNV